MYQVRPTGGIEFYKLLYESTEFCSVLGQVTLASGQLEAELTLLIMRKHVPVTMESQSLGRLIKVADKHNVLGRNEIVCLYELCKQRNYLMHNIYALFSELIEETRLERSGLLDSDVHTYIERAWQLRENLIGLTEIVSKA